MTDVVLRSARAPHHASARSAIEIRWRNGRGRAAEQGTVDHAAKRQKPAAATKAAAMREKT